MRQTPTKVLVFVALVEAGACGGVDHGLLEGPAGGGPGGGDAGATSAAGSDATTGVGSSTGGDAATDVAMSAFPGDDGAASGSSSGGPPSAVSTFSFCCQINRDAWDCPDVATMQRCSTPAQPDPTGCRVRAMVCDGSGPSTNAASAGAIEGSSSGSSGSSSGASSGSSSGSSSGGSSGAPAPSSTGTTPPPPPPPPPPKTCGSGKGGANAACNDCTDCGPGYTCFAQSSGMQGFCTRDVNAVTCFSSSQCTDPGTHCCKIDDGSRSCIPLLQSTSDCN